MDSTARKIDEDGIDTEFESAIDKAMKEGETQLNSGGVSGVRGVSEVSRDPHPRYQSTFDRRTGLHAVKVSETPLDQAHRIFGRTQDLCTRVETLCSALIGETVEPDGEDRPDAQGLMGRLARHGDETDARIAYTNKRLEEIERIMLGHSGGMTATAR